MSSSPGRMSPRLSGAVRSSLSPSSLIQKNKTFMAPTSVTLCFSPSQSTYHRHDIRKP